MLEPNECAHRMVEKYTKENPLDIAASYRHFYQNGENDYWYWNAVIEEIELIQKKIKILRRRET
jgi:hypothetical protein